MLVLETINWNRKVCETQTVFQSTLRKILNFCCNHHIVSYLKLAPSWRRLFICKQYRCFCSRSSSKSATSTWTNGWNATWSGASWLKKWPHCGCGSTACARTTSCRQSCARLPTERSQRCRSTRRSGVWRPGVSWRRGRGGRFTDGGWAGSCSGSSPITTCWLACNALYGRQW